MSRRRFFQTGLVGLLALSAPSLGASPGNTNKTDDLDELKSRVTTLEDNLKKQRVDSPPNVPVGTILPYAGLLDDNHLLDDWLLCDGSAVSATKYEQLWLKVQIADGAGFRGAWGGDGNPDFNLPDLMGRFLRGVDKDKNGNATNPARDSGRDSRFASNSRGNTGNNVGTIEDDALQNHSHDNEQHRHGYKDKFQQDERSDDAEDRLVGHFLETEDSRTTDPATVTITNVKNINGNAVRSDPKETRPKNAYVYWIIRAK